VTIRGCPAPDLHEDSRDVVMPAMGVGLCHQLAGGGLWAAAVNDRRQFGVGQFIGQPI
jgi:hypothetical protein